MKKHSIPIVTAMLILLFGGVYAATNFPENLDVFTDQTSSDLITSAKWNNLQDSIEALEEKVGADNSDVTTSHDYKLIGLATSLGVVQTTLGAITSAIEIADLEKLHALTISASSVNNLPLGYLQRSKFTYVDADTITIGPGVYHHSGTTDQIVYWDSTLTFDSTDTGSQWYYLYISDLAIVTAGTNLLTASEFIKSTTAPTWIDAKHGWYHGNNRCIFAYQVDSGSICEFSHDGGDSVSTVTNAVTETPPLVSGTEVEVDLSLSYGRPGFCSKLDLYVHIKPSSVASTVYVYQFSGKPQLGIHFEVPALSTSTLDIEHLLAGIQLSADMSLYYLSSSQDYAGQLSHYQITGWHFPVGM